MPIASLIACFTLERWLPPLLPLLPSSHRARLRSMSRSLLPLLPLLLPWPLPLPIPLPLPAADRLRSVLALLLGV